MCVGEVKERFFVLSLFVLGFKVSVASTRRHGRSSSRSPEYFDTGEQQAERERTTTMSPGGCDCSHILSPVSPVMAISGQSESTSDRRLVGTIPHAMP